MKIPQREARRLRERVRELEAERDKQRAAWTLDYPGGTHIATSKPADTVVASVRTARKLGHAVVVIERQDGDVNYYALPLAK
jgi:hypothetical protein